ncbi:MAG: acyl-CoA/acyl-ACP dehydrogenase [Gammaproteobacteria bacterium]|nr:acyl-CoA/acyl-ACP dehydrogenase [Gammaproteobacteria bacterium]MBV8404489.1 acyl-CoA/acyl-ACP dehydrogenase [Gammaproteobacteria bacterium]
MEAKQQAEARAAAGAPTTEDLPTRAKTVATVAATHAGAVDSAARFPAEAFQAVKAQRLLGIQVPKALGGEGVGIGDVADVCYQLGQACASSGMIFAMHQIKVACIMRHMGENATLQRMLRRLCTEQLLLASSTTEGQGGGNIRSSEAPVEHQDGGRIALERKASVISYGAYADGVVTTARRSADAAASDQVLIAFFKSDYTLTRLQGWDALGMRGTCSEGYTLKASASAEQILPEPYETIHTRTMVPFAHLLWGSVWTGVAAGATARAQAFVRNAMRHSGQLPPGAPQFTRALATLRTLRGMLATSLRRYEQCMNDPQALAGLEFQTLITLTKVEASELAAQTVMSAMRACGLSGYRNDSEYSIGRHLRDVLSSPIMINNDRILANLATPVLMSPMASSLRD